MVTKSFLPVVLVLVYTLVYVLAFTLLLNQSSTIIFYLNLMHYVMH